jgi:hypothetical protein
MPFCALLLNSSAQIKLSKGRMMRKQKMNISNKIKKKKKKVKRERTDK